MSRVIDVDKLLTVRHYAERLGLTKDTILSRIRFGKMDCVKIDGVFFIMEDELEKEKTRRAGNERAY